MMKKHSTVVYRVFSYSNSLLGFSNYLNNYQVVYGTQKAALCVDVALAGQDADHDAAQITFVYLFSHSSSNLCTR